MVNSKDFLEGQKIKKYISIAFVCSGNTCRSYIAEAAAIHLLKTLYFKKNASLKNKVFINSAGISVILNKIPTNSYKTLDLIDIPNLKSTPSQIDAKLVENSDLIITMAESHKKRIMDSFSDFDKKKIFTLKELSNIILYFQSEKIYRRNCINRGEYILVENQKINFQIKRINLIKHNTVDSPDKKELNMPPVIDTIKDKIFTLKNINRETLVTEINLDINDPYGQPIDIYYKVAKKIKEKIIIIFDYLFT